MTEFGSSNGQSRAYVTQDAPHFGGEVLKCKLRVMRMLAVQLR